MARSLSWRIVAPALVAALAATACRDGRDASAPASSAPAARAVAPTTSSTAPLAELDDGPSTTTTVPVADTSGLPDRPPAAATTPANLARQITVAEEAIRSPATPPAQLAAMAVVQQVAYRHLGTHPELDAAVLAHIPEALHGDVQRNLAARRELRAMHRTLSGTVPPWRIVPPPPAADLLRHYKEAEAQFGVSWQYLAAINLVETGMGRIRGTSIAGAQGPMQFMPATWDAFGEGDINDPRDAILAAGRYLAHNHGATDIDIALWNYNHSDRYVRAVKAYADVMRDDPRTFFGYHGWGIFYLTTRGDVWLPEGYESTERVPVDTYLASQ